MPKAELEIWHIILDEGVSLESFESSEETKEQP